MSVRCEQIAATALRRWLLSHLPAKVTAVNLERAPVLEAALAGPYTILAAHRLSITTTGVDTGHVTVNPTDGVRTAAQLATDINATSGLSGVASADADGRLLLTGAVPSSANGIIGVGEDSTGCNALFGWDAGGERVVAAPLVAPGYKGLADGLPTQVDMGPGFWLIIGKRTSMPVRKGGSVVRTDEYQVGLELVALYREMNIQSHRSREAIHSVVRCVRELLLTDAGRQLGRASTGDIVLVEEKTATVEAVPMAFKGKDAPRGMFDKATLLLSIRVFERPTA